MQTTYLCQVPVAKPIASLLVAVVLADLVFLSAVWTIATFFMVMHVEKTDPRAGWCNGCLEREDVHGGVAEDIPAYSRTKEYESVPGDEGNAGVRLRTPAVKEVELESLSSDGAKPMHR